MDILEITDQYSFEDNRFCGLYVLAGEGLIDQEKATTCDHFFVPAACKKVVIKSKVPGRLGSSDAMDRSIAIDNLYN